MDLVAIAGKVSHVNHLLSATDGTSLGTEYTTTMRIVGRQVQIDDVCTGAPDDDHVAIVRLSDGESAARLPQRHERLRRYRGRAVGLWICSPDDRSGHASGRTDHRNLHDGPGSISGRPHLEGQATPCGSETHAEQHSSYVGDAGCVVALHQAGPSSCRACLR